MKYWYNSIKGWIPIDQEIRSKDNYKYSFQKETQMVNIITGKYSRINSKTDSINICEDKWTLTNHFPNEKTNSKSI